MNAEVRIPMPKHIDFSESVSVIRVVGKCAAALVLEKQSFVRLGINMVMYVTTLDVVCSRLSHHAVVKTNTLLISRGKGSPSFTFIRH